MKKQQILGILSGILVGLLMMTTVFASTGTQWKNLLYDNIKITLDGQTVTPTDANGNAVEPFAIDGTTYLPVRAISNALGLDVGWDQATSSVLLSTARAKLPAPDTFFDMQLPRSRSELKEDHFTKDEYYYIRYVFTQTYLAVISAQDYLAHLTDGSHQFRLMQTIDLSENSDFHNLYLLDYTGSAAVDPVGIDPLYHLPFYADLMIEIHDDSDSRDVEFCIYYDKDSYLLYDDGYRTPDLPSVKTGLYFYDFITEDVYIDDSSSTATGTVGPLEFNERPCRSPICDNGDCTECVNGFTTGYADGRWYSTKCLACWNGRCKNCGGDGIETTGRLG